MKSINAMDLFMINESILKEVNKELTYHGLETSYIVYKILNRLKYKKKDIYKITALAFLHDIGAYKTENYIELKKYHDVDTNNHSIYGYELLKHLAVFEEESSMILYHHHSYKDKHRLIDNIPIKEEAFLISLADTISLAITSLKYNKEKINMYIKDIDMSRFKKEHYEILLELIEEGMINEIISGNYRDEFVKKLISNINITKGNIEKYIILLPLSIDFFSFETSIHTVGVYAITKKICEKLYISKEDVEMIKIGALLHDIGKVCTPKEILEKEESLEKEEYEIMKMHVVYTEKILKDAGVNKEIIKLACRHHEKLDGSGYPKGLRADKLSIGQRIITIADIFCALSEKRHYKDAFSKEKVISIFLDMVSKNHVDRHIVDILIKNYDEILNYMSMECNYFKNILDNMIKESERVLLKVEELEIV